jgi:hypothetical protein
MRMKSLFLLDLNGSEQLMKSRPGQANVVVVFFNFLEQIVDVLELFSFTVLTFLAFSVEWLPREFHLRQILAVVTELFLNELSVGIVDDHGLCVGIQNSGLVADV